jgi:Protein of unknown function (DUF1549)/Protein of unknown function (DUF1553)
MHARRLLAEFAIASLVGVGLATTAVAVETSNSSTRPTEPKSAQAKPLEKLAVPQPASDPVTRRFAPADVKEVPSFRRHVVPLLGKLGCNGRACHGSFQGRGGFRLSLFGYDFKMDHQQLLAGEEPRVNTKNVDASLILQKPTMRIPHEGGLRYKLGSWEHHVLLRWIQGGAVGVNDADPNFVRLVVTPPELRFTKKGEHVSLKVVAQWSDGTNEDVTPLCRYQSNDEQIAKIDTNGNVTSGEPGDSHVVVFYDTGVVPVPVMRPVSDVVGPRYPDVPAPTEIDRLVVNKLKKMGIVPSEVCTDAEFLRRASLDVTGTLPTAKEVAAFVADKSPAKRRRKVDDLLSRPTYAAWWTTRLCDITGNNDQALNNVTLVDQSASQEWYDWVLKRVQANMPYDKIVENIVLAKSRSASQSYTDYAEQLTDLYRKPAERHHPEQQYADHAGLTHFWARRTIGQPQQKALSFAYTFLGIRIQCAECHKHPFDQWTQDDYKEFTKFFVPIRFGVDPADRQQYQTLIEPAQTRSTKNKTGDVRREYPRLLAEGKTLPFEELFIVQQPQRGPIRAQRPRPHKPDDPKKAVAKTATAKTATTKPPATKKNAPRPNAVANKKTSTDASRRPIVAQKPQKPQKPNTVAQKLQKPNAVAQKTKKPQQGARKRPPAPDANAQVAKLLGAEKVDLTQYDDPRVPLMKWLRSKNNRFFARAFVNRVWATYFNVGIVNPPDDLSLANPPSNAELLDYLADGFVKHGYDMKWLHREIVNSRTYQLSWRPNETNRLDQRNFSHAVVRRLPAEVAYDAIREATGSDAAVAKMQQDWRDRAIGVPGSGRRGRGASYYALSVFGRSVRQSNCDCDRSNDPSLLQTVFMRNDSEVLAMVGDPRNGWVAQIASELSPKIVQGRPARAQRQPSSSSATPQSKSKDSQSKDSKSKDAVSKPATTQAMKNARAAQPLRPEQKARQIARLNERIRQLEKDGKTDLVKRLSAQLEELKRRPVSTAAAEQRGRALAAASQLPPKQLSSDKKSQLVKTAYLRTLNRYPDDHEQTLALAYLNDSSNVVSGLRDLLWALVNTEEFIVNH